MDDLRLMQVVESTEYVIDDRLDLSFLKVLGRFQKLLEVHVASVKHEIYLLEFLALRLDDPVESVDAGVLHGFENVELPDQSPGPKVVRENLLVSFDSESSLTRGVQNLHNFTVGTLSQLFLLPEVTRHHEIFVEVFESYLKS